MNKTNLQRIEEMKKLMEEMLLNWDDELDTNYPFMEDMQELTLKMDDWGKEK